MRMCADTSNAAGGAAAARDATPPHAARALAAPPREPLAEQACSARALERVVAAVEADGVAQRAAGVHDALAADDSFVASASCRRF